MLGRGFAAARARAAVVRVFCLRVPAFFAARFFTVRCARRVVSFFDRDFAVRDFVFVDFALVAERRARARFAAVFALRRRVAIARCPFCARSRAFDAAVRRRRAC
jgi:hypothetical protein